MKNLISILTLITFAINTSFATVRTVSNSPLGGSQYSSLQTAYDAAVNGDSLILEGTDIPYYISNCGQYLDKSLTVIGVGINPMKQIPKKTLIRNTDCYNELVLGTGASGSRFYGIVFTNAVYNPNSVNNIVFEDCKFDLYYSFHNSLSSNIIFRNCIFDKDNTFNVTIGWQGQSVSVIFSNCIFDGYIEGNNSALLNVVIDHCVFLGASGHFSSLQYAQISNNIFMNSFPGGTFNASYTNNLCNLAGTFPPNPGDGNTASGNIENSNPLFVNVPVSTFYSTSHNYNLQAGSPAIGAAFDATDIGIHGGFTNFSESGEVLINPIIRSLNILNTSVAPNGTLNVQIHATKPDND